MEEIEFIALVEETLEVDPGTISMSHVLEDIEWDSLCNISFIAEVDSRLGKRISADDLSNAQNVGDLYVLIGHGSGG